MESTNFILALMIGLIMAVVSCTNELKKNTIYVCTHKDKIVFDKNVTVRDGIITAESQYKIDTVEILSVYEDYYYLTLNGVPGMYTKNFFTQYKSIKEHE